MTTDEIVDAKKMKVADLKEALKDHGLSTDGLKAELQKRLIDAVAAASETTTSTPKKVMSKAEKQEALARARLWAEKRHTVADSSTNSATIDVAGEGVTPEDPPSVSDRRTCRTAKRRYQAKSGISDKTGEKEQEEKEYVPDDTASDATSDSRCSSAVASSVQKTSTVISRHFLVVAIVPIALLVGASQFLRATISSPPSDYGSGPMFDLIATRYDFINRALALNLDMSWRKRLVEEVIGFQGELFTSTYNNNNDGESSNIKILDLATGTADVAI
jgi:hypothetical protein